MVDWRERLREAFDQNMRSGAEVGAAVCVWRDGEEVALHGGLRGTSEDGEWDEETLVLVWSATKGPAAACVLHALQEKGFDLESPVAEVWPEIIVRGKERVTFAQIMSHRAGLSALTGATPAMSDHETVVKTLAEQEPNWTPGEKHGYGARTFGFLLDEIVRRVAGKTLGEYWREKFAEPMGLDFWIGLPEKEHGRVARILSARAGCDDGKSPFLEEMAKPESLTRRAFAAPVAPLGASSMNQPTVRSASWPSLGGIGSARALARFYAMLANGGEWEGRRYFGEKMLKAMETPMVNGFDEVLRMPTSFSAGFMKDPVGEGGVKLRKHFGPSLRAFGHPGAGGSLAFADPENRIGFAYVMNQMELGVLPGARALSLVKAIYGDELMS